MTRLDPIIAVKDVEISAKWYQKIFGFRKKGEGHNYFAVLESADGEIILCLHKWGDHNHPTMVNKNITAGNGLLFYFRTSGWKEIKKKLDNIGWPIEEEVHINGNSQRTEFSVRDPDGYFLTVTEYHEYEG